MTARRAPAGFLAVAAFVPPLAWFAPALLGSLAPSFRDQSDFFYPLKLYTADRLRTGAIPLWNPLSGAGEPWLANLQSGVFYPPGLLFLIPRPGLAAILFLLFHFAVAIWGMRRFLQEEGASEAAATAGAVVLAGSGFTASLSAYWNHFGAFAWLPVIVALARGGLHRRRDRLGLALAIGLQAMAGSPEISAASAVLALLFAWRSRPPPDGVFQPSTNKRLARAFAAAALGLLLAGWALVPFAELALRSDRRGALPAAERNSGEVGAKGLLSVVEIAVPGESGTWYLQSLALGPLALLAAAAAFYESERRRLLLLLLGIGVAGVLLASAGPIGGALRSIPPFDRIRYPAKALLLTFFSLAALAGLGFDAFRLVPAVRRRTLLAAAAGGCTVLLLFSRAAAPVRLAEAIGCGALLGCAALGLSRPRRAAALQGLALLALAFSLAAAGRDLFTFVPEGEIRRRPESIARLPSLSGRVLTPPMADLAPKVLIGSDPPFGSETLRRQRESLLGYTNLLSGVRTLRTAAPLATADARRVADSIDASRNLQVAAGSASARVLWTPFQPPNMGSRKMGEFFLAPINPYRPRISFVRRFSIEPDRAKAWERRSRGETDWSREVFLDREPSPHPIAGDAKGGFVLARLEEDVPERVVAEVHSDGAGILVLTDLFYPGWRAETDGRPADILVADGVFRAVALTAGPHRVVFTYRPLSVFAGAACSAAALLVLLGLARRGEPRQAGGLL